MLKPKTIPITEILVGLNSKKNATDMPTEQSQYYSKDRYKPTPPKEHTKQKISSMRIYWTECEHCGWVTSDR